MEEVLLGFWKGFKARLRPRPLKAVAPDDNVVLFVRRFVNFHSFLLFC
jgi:hypothetical protein